MPKPLMILHFNLTRPKPTRLETRRRPRPRRYLPIREKGRADATPRGPRINIEHGEL